MRYLVFLVSLVLLTNCMQKKEFTILSEDDFKYNFDDQMVELYTIRNSNGLICQLTNFGARVVSLYTPDNKGQYGDVVVGYTSGKQFVEEHDNYFGATIGRYGNRIGSAAFELDGVTYELEKNDGENHLHGSSKGFHRQLWEVESQVRDAITFGYISPHMENGYPGNVLVKVKFQLTRNNELKIEYFADSDHATILNLTNHTYFNLKDAGKSSINQHQLYINSDKFTPIDASLIPTGEMADVTETPFDFTNAIAIGDRLDEDDRQLSFGAGYDHNWVLNTAGDVQALAARVIEPSSGRVMEVYSNEPGLQFYGGNFLDGSAIGKENVGIGHRSAFCLETQHFPDSPNKAQFPDVRLEAGEPYYSVCIYKFGCNKTNY